MLEHLQSRRYTPELYTGFSYTNGVASFPLWNLAGQRVGYQEYRPGGTKQSNVPREAKYFTYTTDKAVTAFGLDLLTPSTVCFLVEGVFDAVELHNQGVNCLAVLNNNPKHLRSWLHTMPYYYVALADGDAAGRMLGKVSHDTVYLPEGKDPGDMSSEWLREKVKEVLAKLHKT